MSGTAHDFGRGCVILEPSLALLVRLLIELDAVEITTGFGFGVGLV